MTRRRLILAIVAAALVGMAWWLSLDGLSVEERLRLRCAEGDGQSDATKSVCEDLCGWEPAGASLPLFVRPTERLLAGLLTASLPLPGTRLRALNSFAPQRCL